MPESCSLAEELARGINSLPSTKHTMDARLQIIRVQDVAKPTPNDFCEALYLKPKDNDEEPDEQLESLPNNQMIKCKHRQLLFNLSDGAKLLIKGEIEQSLNILQLRAADVTALGGERLELVPEDQPELNNLLNNDNLENHNIQSNRQL